jgi:hypothetical protein
VPLERPSARFIAVDSDGCVLLHAAWRWWDPDQLERTDEAVLPADLAAVARRSASGAAADSPIELPSLAFEE